MSTVEAPEGHALGLHLNVSPRQIADPDFPAMVEHATAAASFAPERLVLEITETTALDTSDTLVANVARLRAMGVRLALDDFGTGYSSVAAAHGFPLDLIKIDQLFVRPLADPAEASLVRAILAMADSLGLRSVAEGVETVEHLAVLRDLGCPFGQGYLFSRPAPMDQLRAELWHDRAALVSPSS
jgi:EAL domain-containing protein (putative c-di-GMP-specific phosphodiesterase class I)